MFSALLVDIVYMSYQNSIPLMYLLILLALMIKCTYMQIGYLQLQDKQLIRQLSIQQILVQLF